MPIEFYQILHIFSVMVLTGITFAALAAPRPEARRLFLMWSGIFALLSFVSGFGLLGLMRFGFPGWIIVKLACWLALAALTGLVFRRPAQARSLMVITVLAVLIAVGMVVLKPF